MKNLPKLIKLVELTRNQPQYGYALAGISKGEQSDLAQHHYLVSFIAWQLARAVNRDGGDIDVEKVLEFAMIHDLGELFGGDINFFYGRVNPEAKKHAKAFEAENAKFLSDFFGEDKEHYEQLAEEILDAKSDECIVAKVADYVECINYKLMSSSISKIDMPVTLEGIEKMLSRTENESLKKTITSFIEEWQKSLGDNDTLGIIWEKKK